MQVSAAKDPESAHIWTKNKRPIQRFLLAFSSPGDVIYDPFTGSGTIPRVCAENGRRFVASEIEPEIAARARERVRNTPPPLFVLDALDPSRLALEDLIS